MDLSTATYDELCEAYDAISQYLSEMAAENANERAMFGDSAPGSAIDEFETRQKLNAVRREIDARLRLQPPALRTVTLIQYEPGNMIPF